MVEYESLVHAIIALGPLHMKSTLIEVLLHLNLWQYGRLVGKDVEQWGRAQAFNFRNLVALSRKVASRCTSGLRRPLVVRSLVHRIRHQKTVSSTRKLLQRRSFEEAQLRGPQKVLPSEHCGSQKLQVGHPIGCQKPQPEKYIWALYGLKALVGPDIQYEPVLISSSQ